ncbi:MAG TPA: hypothetical protein VGE23_00905 [Candidatus Paceibacterota bacterium]
MQASPAHADLKAVLAACDSQDGRFPAALSLAPGLSLIVIGLQSVEAALEQIIDQDEQLPPELEKLVEVFYDRGTAAYAALHARTRRA